MKEKTKQVCCIIGGTSGIGKAIAEGFVKKGYTVVVSGRNAVRLKKTAAALQRLGNSTRVMQACDVTKKRTMEALLKKILSSHKRVDVCVVAAGAHMKKKALKVSLEDWEKIIRVNLTGTFLADQVFGAAMVKRKQGCIINIASLGSFVALTDVCAYSSSKGGVVMLTKSLAVEWAVHNVRVNALVPGVFPTPLNRKALSEKKRLKNIISRTPAGRLGKAEEIVSAALFLASPDSSFVTGTCLPVDGGFLAWSGF